MNTNKEFCLQNYLQERLLPSFWCPGCGMGTITQSLLRAIDKLNWGKDEVIQKLDTRMSAAFKAVIDLARQKKLHMRDAAYIIAINRVAFAVKSRGWV